MIEVKVARLRLSKDDRRAQILTVATELVGRKGFNNLSLKELARETGITDAGILHHFGSKNGLLLELLRARDREDERVLGLRFSGQQAAGSVEAILGVLRAIVIRNVARPELLRLFAVLRAEALIEGHPAHDYFARREAATVSMFADIVAQAVEDPNATARQIVAAMNGLEVQWLLAGQTFDLADDWDKVASKLIR